MSNTDLKPCPFCGSENVHTQGNDPVFCRPCGAEGPAALTEAGAVELWNDRAPTPEPVKHEVTVRAERRKRDLDAFYKACGRENPTD